MTKTKLNSNRMKENNPMFNLNYKKNKKGVIDPRILWIIIGIIILYLLWKSGIFG